MQFDKIIKLVSPYIKGAFLGALAIVMLNSFDKVVTVNIWPSVLTAHGELN